MTSKVSNERVIRTLPRWYSDAACPYVSDSFVPEVTEYVHKQASNGMNRLRMGKCILVGDFDIGNQRLLIKQPIKAIKNIISHSRQDKFNS